MNQSRRIRSLLEDMVSPDGIVDRENKDFATSIGDPEAAVISKNPDRSEWMRVANHSIEWETPVRWIMNGDDLWIWSGLVQHFDLALRTGQPTEYMAYGLLTDGPNLFNLTSVNDAFLTYFIHRDQDVDAIYQKVRERMQKLVRLIK